MKKIASHVSSDLNRAKGMIRQSSDAGDTSARFLSPDPVLQDAGNLQAHNRYSYCLNNPLKYTDPTGYFFDEPRSGKPLGEPYFDDGVSENSTLFLESGVPDAWDGFIEHLGYNEVFNNIYEQSHASIQNDPSNVIHVPRGQYKEYLDFLRTHTVDELFDYYENKNVNEKEQGNKKDVRKKPYDTQLMTNCWRLTGFGIPVITAVINILRKMHF